MMNQLNEFVRLVRVLKEKSYESNSITGQIMICEDSLQLIDEVSSTVEIDFTELSNGIISFREKINSGAGEITEISANHKKIGTSPLLVYKDFYDLFRRYNPFIHGLLDEFYLLDEDIHYPKDDNDNIKRVKSVISFVYCLSKLSMYKDSDKDGYSLVFIGYDKDRYAEPVAIDTVISLDELKKVPDDFEFSLVEKLCDEGNKKSDIHFESKLSIFNSTMSEFLVDIKDRKEAFIKLLCTWPEFVDKYQKNLSIFTSGYVFGKIKHELAEKEIEVADSFSKVISDISTKILSIPISLLVVFFLRNLSGFADYALAIFALSFLSIFVFVSVVGQKKNFDRVVQAKDIYFEKAGSNSSKEVDELIFSVKEGLYDNERYTGFVINILMYASWLPLIAGVIYMAMKFDFSDYDLVNYFSCSSIEKNK